VYDQLKELLINSFQVPEESITPNAGLEDLELDSLDVVELSLAIQQRLAVKVSEDEILELASLSALIGLIEARTAEAL
jgi:acyl carrier protein